VIEPRRLLRKAERRQHAAAVLYLVPAGLLFALLYVYPLVLLLLTSLFDPAFTLRHYEYLVARPVYLRILLLTFRVAATVTLVSLLLGYPIAFLLTTAPARRTRLVMALVLLPFWISVLVRNYAWVALLSRTGVVNRVLLATGLVAEPIVLMFNPIGVMIGLTYILIPFMIFALYSVMSGIDRELLRAAASLGATPWQGFLRVFLPLSLPGVAAGSLLVFIMGIGSFITPALLGGGRVPMIATLIESQVREVLNWGLGSAIAVVLLLTTLGLYAVYSRVLGAEHLLGSDHRV